MNVANSISGVRNLSIRWLARIQLKESRDYPYSRLRIGLADSQYLQGHYENPSCPTNHNPDLELWVRRSSAYRPCSF